MSQLFLYYIEAVRPLELLLPRPIMAVLLFVIFFGGENLTDGTRCLYPSQSSCNLLQFLNGFQCVAHCPPLNNDVISSKPISFSFFFLPLIRWAVELLTRINNRTKRYTRKERIVRCCVRGYLVHCNMLGFIRQKFVLTRSLPLFCYWLVSFLITDTLCILHTARDCGPHNRVKLKLRPAGRH